MGISEKKMKIVIDNYFHSECNVNTSIRSAFEKGFRIGVGKGLSAQPEQQLFSYGQENDLISRRAAVDTLMEILDRPNHAEFLYTDEICKALEDLPSAQPEIIRCEDCKYHDKGENESESWNLCGYRPWLYVPVTYDHYCGYAERRISDER